MRTFAQEALSQATSNKSTATTRPHLGRIREVDSILYLQRSVGNQAVGRLLEDARNTSYAYDVSRMAIHANPQAEIPPKLAIGSPGDIHEQEAERAAERVVDKHDSGVSGCEPEKGSGRAIQGNEALPSRDRTRFERLFGHDFSQVRIHNETSAAEMADALNADAFTVGHDVYFGAGKLQPRSRESDRLVAHELTHVVQQSRTGPALQPKLKITGKDADVARVIALLNSGLQQYRVSVDKSGDVTILQNFVELDPNPQQKALADRLSNIINDPKDVNITVSAGSKSTLVGSYATGDVDIDDIEAIGVSALIHEIEEQYQKQVKSVAYGSETTGAHAEGIKAESEVLGAVRGPQKAISASKNADGTVDAVVEVPYTYPDGTVKTMVMTIKGNNVASVIWK